MDKNKFNKLRDISFEIKKTCSTCKFSSFSKDGDESSFAKCAAHTYLDKRGREVELTIHRSGHCPLYESNWYSGGELAAWACFIQGRADFLIKDEHDA